MDRALRILYLHPAGGFGGASKSLIELFGRLHAKGVEGDILTPRGSAALAFESAGLNTTKVAGLSQFDNTLYGHYRRLRWLILLRELWFLPGSLLGLWRLRKQRYDLIHVNEITLLLLGLVAKAMFRTPLVLHVRSVQCAPGSNLRSKWINGLVRRHVDRVVAIDHTVARTLDERLTVSVIHNSISLGGGGDVSVPPRPESAVRVGIFGVLIPAKGVVELVEAVRILKTRGTAVECWIAGENPRAMSGPKAWLLSIFGFARDLRAELEALVERYDLAGEVKFLGFVGDVRSLYRGIDILCFPSHLNAAGRPVFEAALFGVPSIVALRDPLPDAIVDGVTGLAISSPEPDLIARAIERLVTDPPLRERLGRQAKRWADEIFSLDRSALALRSLYDEVIAGPGVRS